MNQRGESRKSRARRGYRLVFAVVGLLFGILIYIGSITDGFGWGGVGLSIGSGFLLSLLTLLIGLVFGVAFSVLKKISNAPVPNTVGGQMLMGIVTAFALLLLGRLLGIEL